MSEGPTIRDIAEKLCLGKSTVQRALTGKGCISSRSRQRVMDAARKLGYRPDPLFSMLGSQRRRLRLSPLRIAYVSRCGFTDSLPPTRIGVDLFNVARLRGEILGYNVERVDPGELGAGKRLMDVLYNRGFLGVILGQVRFPDHEAILLNTHLPVVCCGRIDPLPLHTVQPDITQMVRLAWRHMLAAGYRRIGAAICVHAPSIEDDSDRLGAVLQCQEETLRRNERVPPYRGALDDAMALLGWFHRYKPEAVLGFTIGQYYALRDSGLDMSNIAYASLHTTLDKAPFAGIQEPEESISTQALNLLDHLIRLRSFGIPHEPLHILLPGCWIDGASLPEKNRVKSRCR
jgi:LacI family transcriptional regulator